MNIKRKNLALTIAAVAGFSLVGLHNLQAQTNRYWDPSGGGTFGNIGTNSGAGTNTWMPSANIIWTNSISGNTSRLQNFTTTLTDRVNFGGLIESTRNGKLGAGTIPVTVVNAHSIVFNNFASVSGNSTITLSGGQITLAAATSVTVNNNQDGTLSPASHVINSSLAGGATSFAKLGPGIISLTGANTFTGPTTVSAGILTLGNNLALQNSTLDTTASILGDATNGLKTTVPTLTLGGLSGNKDFASVFTTTAGGFETVTALTVNTGAGINTYTGAIADGAVGMTFAKSGVGTQVLGGANTFTGSTTISAGTLTLDYSTQDNSKLSDTAALELGGVTLNLSGGTHAEIVGSTTINPGLTQIVRTSGTTTLNLGAITALPGGAVNFSGSNIFKTSTPNNAGGYLGLFATIGGSDLAANDGSGNIVAFTGYVDINARGPSTIADAPVSIVRILGDGTSGNIELGSTTTTITSLLQSNANFAATVNTATKTLALNSITIGTGNESLNIGAAAGDGVLRTSTPGGVLSLANNSSTKTLTVNAVIADNTSPSGLSSSGSGLVNLAAANTYTGPTTVSTGTLGLSGSITGSDITTSGSGAFSQTGTGVIAGGTTFTQSSTATSTLAGVNTYTGATNVTNGVLRIQNSSALGSDVAGTTISSGAALEMQGGITVATEALSISGSGISSGGVLRNITGNNTYTGPITLGGDSRINSDADTLTLNSATSIAGTGSITVGGAGNTTISSPIDTNITTISKDGAGTLTLSGVNTFTGLHSVSAGTLKVGSATAINPASTLFATGTGVFDMNGFNTTFTGGLSGASTAKITDNSAGPGTTVLTLNKDNAAYGVTIADGPTKVVAVEVSNDNGSNVIGFRLTSATNTFSGGLTLIDDPLATRLWFSTIVPGAYGTGPITIGKLATDRAGVVFQSQGVNPTLSNAIVVNTNLAADGASLRVDNSNTTLNGKLTANLADAFFIAATTANGSANLTNQVTGPMGLTVGVSSVTGSIMTTGSITVTLTNPSLITPNDYAGNTTIQSFSNVSKVVLRLGANDQIPNGAGKGNVIADSTLNLNGFSDTINGLSGAGVVDGFSGTPTLTVGDNNATGQNFSGVIQNSAGDLSLNKIGTGTQILSGSNTYSGPTKVSAGILSLENSLAMQNSPLDTAGTITGDATNGLKTTVTTLTMGGLTGNKNVATTFTTTAGGYDAVTTLTLNPVANAVHSYSGVITDGAAGMILEKTGTGTQILTGANLYTGGTNINGGTLLVNNTSGSGTGPGAVTVAPGAGLGGTGTISGLTTVNGIVTPGSSGIGTLNITNNTTWNSNDNWLFQLGTGGGTIASPGTGDLLNITGDFVKGSGGPFTFDFANTGLPGTYKLVDWSVNTTFVAGDFAATNFSTGLTPTFTVDAGSTALYLTLVAPTFEWVGASANWSTAGNWNPATVPNASADVANFLGNGQSAVSVDTPHAVNILNLNSTTTPYIISGPDVLSFVGGGALTPKLTVASTNTASHTIDAVLNLGNNTTIAVNGGSLSLNSPTNATLGAGVTATIATGATLNLGGAGNALSDGGSTHANVANSGTLTATTAGKRVGEISGSGTTTVTAAGATLTANHIRQSTLNIGAGNTVTVATNGGNSGTSVVTNLNINATGKLDLNDNDLVVDNGNLATLTSKLATGLDINGSYGNGPGITSNAFATNPNFNTVLGIAANVELGYTSFSGQTVDANDILIKYTYYGDADLSGSVDTSTDFDLYITGLTSGGSLGGWLFGDFDYNGTVDSSTDFDLYITGLTTQGGALLTGGGGNSVQAVPEPSTFVLGGLALLGFAGAGLRRRRMAKQAV